MKKLSKFTAVLSAVCLTLSATNIQAFAADNSDVTQQRIEDLDYLYNELKKTHPNIFANSSEKQFETLITDIKTNVSEKDDFEFAMDLEKLTALVGDSHTSVSLGSSVSSNINYFPIEIEWFDGKWYLTMTENSHSDLIGTQVTAINGISMDDILNKFSPFISHDNDVKLRRQFTELSYVASMYEYAGIISDGDPIKLTLSDKEGKVQNITVNQVDLSQIKTSQYVDAEDKRSSVPETAYDKTKYYFSKPLNETTYYIQYNKCSEDKNYPMADFCAQIKSDLDSGSYTTVLVDLRYNGGGSDGVIAPLLLMLRQEIDNKGLQVSALIGEQTFSSAIINAIEFQEMGCALVGEKTSGSIDHFGSVDSFQLPNSQLKVNVSTKYIAMSNYFDSAIGKGVESLVPDVEINQTIQDYLAGKDTCVEKILADDSCVKLSEHDDQALTRGRFIGKLYKAFGSPSVESNNTAYKDLFGFEWYINALNWASENNIASGSGDGTFSSSRQLTWQEAAVFLTNAAKLLGADTSNTSESDIPKELLKDDWSREYVQCAWGLGLIPHDSNFSGTPNRSDGIKMIQAISSLK